MRGARALLGALLLLSVGTGCQTGVAGSPTPGPTSAAASASTGPSPAASASTEPSRTASGPATYAPTIVSALSANSVTWTDAHLVPASTNNVRVEPLAGSEHQHTARFDPSATFLREVGPGGVPSLDSGGYGTYPTTRPTSLSTPLVARIDTNEQGLVIRMAIFYQP